MASKEIALDPLSNDGRARSKAFGIGSAGCSIISRSDVTRAAFSTSEADLERSGAAERLVITPQRLAGLYETDPSIIAQSPSVAGRELHELFKNTDVAYLFAGMGGVSGSLGTAVLGTLARSNGALPVALVTFPFSAESARRREFAAKCLRRVFDNTDLCIVFENDALSELAPRLPLSKAFAVLNGIMQRQMMDLAAILDRTGFRVLKESAGGARHGRFGLGLSRGDDRIDRVVEEAFSSPWFDFDVRESSAAVAVYSAADPWEREEMRIVENLQQRLVDTAIIHGSYQDSGLGERIRLSLLLLRRP